MRKKLNESYQQVVSQYIANLNYKVEIYQTYLTNIGVNQNINSLLRHKNDYTHQEIYDIGKKISTEIGLLIGTRSISELRNIMVYIYDESLPIYSPKVTNVKKVHDEDWYIEIHNDVNKGYVFYDINDHFKDMLSLYKLIIGVNDENYGERLGFVKLDINTDGFFRFEDGSNKTKKGVYVLDGTGQSMWGNGDMDIADISTHIQHEIQSSESGTKLIEIDGVTKRLFYKTIPMYGWKVLFLFDTQGIDNYANETRQTIIIYLIILVLIVMGIIFLFSKKFSGRIDLIIKKMEKVEKGNLKITDRIQGHDEISVLDMHFNEMVYRLEELINSNYVQKLERREAELNALQFQINPHFLYNTLESINSLAAIHECYEICEISHKLGEMFRYSMNKDTSEYVFLENEIEHIRNYIYIQSIRFKDRFEVFYNLEKHTKRLKILRFILQPIVENAIIHGFRNKKTRSCLEISTYLEQECLYIKVMDDGHGMSQEQVEQLNYYINERDESIYGEYKKSIGIKNVNMRIKLSCGDPYGIRIESKEGMGTVVMVKLPINT